MSSSKFKAENISFAPKNYHASLDSASVIREYILSLTDEETKNRVDILNASNSLMDFESEVLDSFKNDYDNTFLTYVTLAKNGLVKESFNFRLWAKEAEDIDRETTITNTKLNAHKTLEGIYELSKINLDLAKEVFKDFLSSDLDRNSKNIYYFSILQFVADKVLPEVKFVDLLKCSTLKDIEDLISGKSIPANGYKRIVDAAVMFATPNTEVCESIDDVINSVLWSEKLNMTLDGFRAKCREFKNGDIWKAIENDRVTWSEFIKKFLDNPEGLDYFFMVGKNYYDKSSGIRFNGVKEGMLGVFFDEVVKGNKDFGSYMLDVLNFAVPNKLVMVAKDSFGPESQEAMKIMEYHHLNEGLSNSVGVKRNNKI